MGISNTIARESVSILTERGILIGIKLLLNEKKMWFEWGVFTGISLEKDCD